MFYVCSSFIIKYRNLNYYNEKDVTKVFVDFMSEDTILDLQFE